jgi:thymidylate synthase
LVYRNAARAFVGELSAIREFGTSVRVRERDTQELLARSIQIARPSERCITVPGRRNDVFAAIAETMWVLAGRDDLAFLSTYLPRAGDYSDDGTTWRGAYGPRLRNWHGIDQLFEVVRILRADMQSRRAVISLYDPARDFVSSKDIPCNNWLHFIVRDGSLDLSVATRSNDIFWGFSGINTFEWSVLQEIVASWLGVSVGRVTYFISSLHLYSDFAQRADHVLAERDGRTGYETGWIQASFSTELEDFAAVVDEWFRIEELIRGGLPPTEEIRNFPDPLLRQFLLMIQIKWAVERGAHGEVSSAVQELGSSDLAYWFAEHSARGSRALPSPADKGKDDWAAIRTAIAELHRRKDASYADSWKRRGEVMGVLANIARKVDRIRLVSDGATTYGESFLDTAIDLYVYTIKYSTFLADESYDVALRLGLQDLRHTHSDGVASFNFLLDRQVIGNSASLKEHAAEVAVAFADLELAVLEHPNEPAARMDSVAALQSAAALLVQAIFAGDAESAERFFVEMGEK